MATFTIYVIQEENIILLIVRNNIVFICNLRPCRYSTLYIMFKKLPKILPVNRRHKTNKQTDRQNKAKQKDKEKITNSKTKQTKKNTPF